MFKQSRKKLRPYTVTSFHCEVVESPFTWFPGWRRSPAGGNGNLLQYSCLENPMGKGAWRVSLWGCQEPDTTERLKTHSCYLASPLLFCQIPLPLYSLLQLFSIPLKKQQVVIQYGKMFIFRKVGRERPLEPVELR